MVVLHHTAMATCTEAADRLCDPAHEVSCHYLIGHDGAVLRLVPEDRRAWHAGVSRWGDVRDVNSRSIGIELDNDGRSPFAAPMMDALETLLADIVRRHAIAPRRVLAHSDIAPGRKTDPGPRFDWRRLARRGLAIVPSGFILSDEFPPEAPAPSDSTLAAVLGTIGYDPDLPTETLLAAFRLRVRPQAIGPADAVDLALARDVAARFAVDQDAATA